MHTSHAQADRATCALCLNVPTYGKQRSSSGRILSAASRGRGGRQLLPIGLRSDTMCSSLMSWTLSMEP